MPRSLREIRLIAFCRNVISIFGMVTAIYSVASSWL